MRKPEKRPLKTQQRGRKNKLVRIIPFILAALFLAGCTNTQQVKTPPPAPQKEAPVLRDPFRPDHPTREEVEAERAQKKAEKPQQ